MELDKLLYPRGLKKWFGVPPSFPDGSRMANLRIENVRIKVIIRESNGSFKLSFLGHFQIGDLDENTYDFYLPIVEVHKKTIRVPDADKFYDEIEGFNYPVENKLWPKYIVYANGQKKKELPVKFDFSTKQVLPHQIDMFNSPENDTILSVKFGLWDRELPLPLCTLSRTQVKELDRTLNPQNNHSFVWKENENITWEISKETSSEGDFFSVRLEYTPDNVVWQGIRGLYNEVVGVEKTKGVVWNWMPIEMAQNFASVASRIILAFFKNVSNDNLLLYRFDKKTGDLQKRKDFTSDEWQGKHPVLLLPPTLEWNIEMHSMKTTVYENIERRFRELTNRNIVTLSDKEMDELDRLFVQLKQFRQVGSIECKICATPTNMYDPESRKFYCSAQCQGVDYGLSS